MEFNQRVIKATTDISTEVNDYKLGPTLFAIQTTQYVYIGQEVPFNNLWFEVSTANDVAAVLTLEAWHARQWQPVVDLTDRTIAAAAAGKSLSQSGRISWSTEWNKGWDYEDRCELVTGLENFEIYNLFWARLAWSGNLKATTALRYVGQKFCTDADLFTQYPDLRQTSLMSAFESGKTDWKQQAVNASDMIIKDMIERRLIEARGQVIDWSIMVTPGVHKTAELIYGGLGKAFWEHADRARKAYAASMNKEKFRVDLDKDAKLSIGERKSTTYYAGR